MQLLRKSKKGKLFSCRFASLIAFTLKQTISKLLFIFANIIFKLIKLHEKNATEMNFFFNYRKTCSNKREALFNICTRLKWRQFVRMINTVSIRRAKQPGTAMKCGCYIIWISWTLHIFLHFQLKNFSLFIFSLRGNITTRNTFSLSTTDSDNVVFN